MPELPYTTSDVKLLKIGLLACPTKMVWSSSPYKGRSKVEDNGSHAHTLI